MDFLSDPKGDRVVKDLDAPPLKPLAEELLFPPCYKGKPNWRLLRDHL
jgi:serine/threonine-protein phosphatase 2B catalytic subunit